MFDIARHTRFSPRGHARPRGLNARCRNLARLIVACVCLTSNVLTYAADGSGETERITLRAWGVASGHDLRNSELVALFRKRFPHIDLVPPGGLRFGGNERNVMFEVLPLMQIAGGVQPDVMHMWLGHGVTYVGQRFLHPLDKHLEQSLGLDIKDGHLLPLDEYLSRLKTSPTYATDIGPRAPDQVWPAMRLPCPYAESCAYLRKWDMTPASHHEHVWTLPAQVIVDVLVYRRDLFREAGLPDRPPQTLEEMLQFARQLTDPDQGAFGMRVDLQNLGRTAGQLLGSMGGQIAARNVQGKLTCAYNSEAAVEACHFMSRMFHEPFTNRRGVELKSIVFPGASPGSIDSPPWRGGIAKIGMFFDAFDQKFYWSWRSPSQYGHGAVPKGPGGRRGGDIGGRLIGAFAGLDGDDAKLDAAWQWIRFYEGPDDRKIFARLFVEQGQGAFLQPKLLKETGFDAFIPQVPRQWVQANDESLRASPPVMVGTNLNAIDKSFANAVDQILSSTTIQSALAAGDGDRAKTLIRQILHRRATLTNEQMLKMLTPQQARFRSRAAIVTVVAILVIFALVMRHVLKAFAASQVYEINQPKGNWQFGRYRTAYILLIPAVGSIAIWIYYPLARGTVMAFQDYNVRGFSNWVGMENFADVLFSEEFWHSMWISLKYVLMFAIFGFTAPIVLAFLLTEVPKGKIFFRTIYYLPAVLSGIVVMFLWKGFYGPYGMINQLLNIAIDVLNVLPGVALEHMDKSWLRDPNFALLFVMLPVIWVSAGPGCLIYLAALKTIPEELYEAADIDGAGIFHKVFHVAIPGIKGLIMINFIGVMVGQMRGGSEFVLAMTQGGPYTPYGETEVVGLHIYWQAFGYLKFGMATAMAWVLGSMLIGFTVLQLKRLSRMEFRAATGVK